MTISLQEKERIAKAVISGFPLSRKGRDVDRPLLAAIAIYVACNPGINTNSIVTQFKFHIQGRRHRTAQSIAHFHLKRLMRAGIIRAEKQSRYVPRRRRRAGSGAMKMEGINRTVQNHTAAWFIVEPEAKK